MECMKPLKERTVQDHAEAIARYEAQIAFYERKDKELDELMPRIEAKLKEQGFVIEKITTAYACTDGGFKSFDTVNMKVHCRVKTIGRRRPSKNYEKNSETAFEVEHALRQALGINTHLNGYSMNNKENILFDFWF